ncbi:hypothetical protein HMPREF0183_2048 [Brevibacterium mcbrellneri ATCC 49030]|uniref:Uncharacterized protein n=1 Tax=Brevibacterium mcbrellneri ATCC 49030 TaxID=585530 RepID=D4YQ38_9MICO|nr:hypothetical protein HMPREF0183_2048 [Brevibacterium mcbrellneri ATCC 49030]
MSYTKEQRRLALRVFKRTKSVTKTIRELGYPGRRTMHRWVREGVSPRHRVRRRVLVLIAGYRGLQHARVQLPRHWGGSNVELP